MQKLVELYYQNSTDQDNLWKKVEKEVLAKFDITEELWEKSNNFYKSQGNQEYMQAQTKLGQVVL